MAARTPYREDHTTERADNRFDLQNAERQSQLDGSHESIPGYDRSGDGLDAREDEFSNSAQSVGEAESNPSDSYTNNWAPGGGQSGTLKLRSKLFKRAAPVGIIVGFLLGLAGLASFFGGPGLLIVNIAEVIESHVNFQLTGMSESNKRILMAKVKNTTTGVCGSTITLRCKYATFSQKEVDDFKAAGIEIVSDGNTKITGRTKAASFVWEGNKIEPKDFQKLYNAPDGKFRTAINRAHSPKLAGTSDSIFMKILALFKSSKKAPFDESENTDEARSKKMRQVTKEGTNTFVRGAPDEPEKNCDKACTDRRDKQNGISKDISDIASEAESSGEKATTKATKALASGSVKTATSFLKATGPIDNVCSVYGMLRGTTLAIKAVRRAQLIRYSMQFLTTASMIKAGKARPGDVSYLGNLLTKIVKEVKTENGKTTTTYSKAATDSSFFLNVMDPRNTAVNDNATQWMAGGGLGGKLESVTRTVLGFFGSKKDADSKCSIINNPGVQAASLVAGIAILFFPGGPAIKLAQLGAQAAIAGSLFAAQMLLPGIIADIVNGNLIDDSTFGESSGNIIVSGATALMSASAASGGTPLLRVNQSQRIAQQQEQVRQEYIAMERQERSPFDISSPYTALGSIYTQLLPVMYGSGSAAQSFSSVASLVSSAAGRFAIPYSYAAGGEDAYGGCQDIDLNSISVSCTISGVEARGIDVKHMDNPDVVYDRLIASGDIEESGEPKSAAYKTFIKDCVDRTIPVGTKSDEDTSISDGSNCFVDYPEDTNKANTTGMDAANRQKLDWYQHLIYQRSIKAMEEDYPDSAEAPSATTPTATGPISSDGWTWPAKSKLVGGPCYGKNSIGIGAHAGMDININEANAPIYAMHDGVVSRITSGGASGNMLQIKTPDNIYYGYQHLSSIAVKEGDQVKAGQQVAIGGKTGRVYASSPVHLHVTASRSSVIPSYGNLGESFDPMKLLPQPAPDGYKCY